LAKKKSKRARRRGSDGPMPMGGAGLIRFFQDESTGIKVGPIVTILLSVLLIVIVIMAQAGVFEWLLGLGA
jgi:preprotein translocase subunit Sec61beta